MDLIDLTESDSSSDHPSSYTVDIVFVHGLRETGLKAWTDVETGVLWMRDLFPHRKYRARCLIYEYDAETLTTPGALTVNGLYGEAVTLLNQLESNRALHNAAKRPIVFVCHEFGGILVKRALAYSHSKSGVNVEHLRSIYRSTGGIIFMGTPHQGFTKDTILLSHKNHQHGPSQFVLTLIEGSEVLHEVTDQFAPLMKDFRIYNFWEEEKTIFGRASALLVEPASAAPSWDVDKCGIRTTNSRMAKFNSHTSPGYQLVLATLDRYIKSASRETGGKWEQDCNIVQKEREHEAQALLSTDNMFLEGRSEAPYSVSTSRPVLRNQSSIKSAESMSPEHEPPGGATTPPYANVHYFVRTRSEYFVGRQKQMENLQKSFGQVESKSRGKPKVFVIYGLPGSGKSQFCLRYLEERRHEYWGVFWVDCTTEETAEEGFALMGGRAGKGCEPGAGQAWLSQTPKPWLLALDNANDPNMDLSKFIPITGNGHILVTTRNPGAQLHNTAGCYQFRGMDPEEAITLLLRLAYPEREARETLKIYGTIAESIASELGYLALALKQAAFSIRRGLRPLERYLQSLLVCRKSLLSQIKDATEANIISTWELPFKGISDGKTTDYRDAVDLVHIFAFMHFRTIPSNVFQLCSDNFKLTKGLRVRPLALVEPTSVQLVEDRIFTAAKVLFERSIISITEARAEPGGDATMKNTSGKYFTLHPAIHRWARERLDLADQQAWLGCTAAILEQSISTNMETSGRAFRRLLLPHIESCMSLLKTEYPNLPETLEQAFQLEKFGLVYAEAGQWATARGLQLSIVNIRMKALGRRHPSTIRAQKILSNTYWNLFEIKHCLEVQRSVLITQWLSRPTFLDWVVWPPWKAQHVSYCTTLDDLTRSLWLAGKRDLSKRTGTRAFEALTRSLGPDDPLTLSAMFNLARTCLHVNEHERSYDLLVEVLAKREHFFGPEHPDTLMARNELGMNLCSQRIRLDEAERLVRNVLELRKKVLGEEHAYTLWSVNDLSKVCCELRRFDEARIMLEDIKPIVKRTLGDKHAGMIMTDANLSRVYILCNMWDKAHELIRRLRDVVPPEHPDRIHAEWGHAYILLQHEDNPEEAEKCCHRIMSWVSDTGVLAPDSARVIATAELLLQIYQDQQRNDEAAKLKEKYPQLGSTETRGSIDHMPLHKLKHRKTSKSTPPLRLRSASTF